MRCRCGYTFEYARSRGHRVTAGAHAGMIACAVVAAAITGYLAMQVEPSQRPTAGAAALLIGAGAFSFVGGLAGWSWFLGWGRARLVRAAMGTVGARYFYALIGGALAGAGVGFLV